MIRTIIVGTIGQYDGQVVGVMPGTHQMVGGRLGGGVRGARIVGCGLAESADLAKRAEHLVSRNMMEAEALLLCGGQGAPEPKRRLQQRKRPDHIGLDAFAWPIDRTVDVAFGG